MLLTYGKGLPNKPAPQLWDAGTGQLLFEFRSNQTAWWGAFSPDSKRVVLNYSNVTARVWDIATAKPVSPPMRHEKPIRNLAFSPDGRLLCTASVDGSVRVWNARTGNAVGAPLHHERPVWLVKFSPDGRRIVSAMENGTVHVWDTVTGKALTQPRNYLWAQWGFAFHPSRTDGRILIVQSRAVDTMTGKEVAGVGGDGVWDPSGTRIAACLGFEQTVRIWNAKTGRALTPPMKHDEAVYRMAFSPDGSLLETSGTTPGRRPIWLWDAATGEQVSPPMINGWPPVPFSWLHNPRTDTIVRQRNDGRIRVRSLPLETRSIEDLEAVSLLMSGHKITVDAGGDAADPAVLRSAAVRLGMQSADLPIPSAH